MEIAGCLTAFVFILVWVMFVSYVVGSLVFRGAAPVQRAALTAGTATVLAAAISFGLEQVWAQWPAATADFTTYALFIPAGLAEFGMLYRWFKKQWVSDEDVAEAFH